MKINSELEPIRDSLREPSVESHLGPYQVKIMRHASINLPNRASGCVVYNCTAEYCNPDSWGCMGDCSGHCWGEGGPKPPRP